MADAIWQRECKVTQNADAPFSWGFASLATSANGNLSLSVPYSFSGTTVIFTASETSDPTSPQLVRLTSTSGAITFATSVSGVSPVATVNWLIPHATTINLPVGTWYFDLLWENVAQNIYLASGPFIVSGSSGR